MKLKTLFCLGLLLAVLLSACASPAPTATPTALPTLTATVTSTPTVTPTPSATHIPATPEYEGDLSYDPETRALNNPHGTQVFTLSEDNIWQELVPGGTVVEDGLLRVVDGEVCQIDGGECIKVNDARGRDIKADFVVYTENGLVAMEQDDNGIERAKTWLDSETQEIRFFKPGSVVEVDGQWYRYMNGEVVEWDIWEPGFSVDFTGTIDEQPGKEPITIPFSLGLMPDIMERDELPIIGIYGNPDRPDGPDKLARHFLRMCWYNYNREHEDSPVNWDEYLDLVRAGEGKYRVVVANPDGQTWNGPMPQYLEIIERAPIDGFEINSTDEFYGRSEGSCGEVVIFKSGKLVILVSFSNLINLTNPASRSSSEKLGFGYGFSLFNRPLSGALVGKTIDDVVEKDGYVNHLGTGQYPASDLIKYNEDMVDPITGLFDLPYFLIDWEE